MNAKVKNDYSIQSVSVALSLLEQFSKGVNEYTLSELSRALKVNKNKVFRLLATLELNEFIVRNEQTGGYCLGNKALSLGRAYINSRKAIRESRPVLEELSGICNETVTLVLFRNDSIIVEDIVESTCQVRAVFQIGETLPMNCSAAGSIYAAYVDSMNSKNLFILKTGKIKEVLAKGYALLTEDSNSGAVEIAAPIRNHDSHVIGAVSVHGPTTRLAGAPYLAALSLMVREASEKISNHLGYCAPINQYDRYSSTESPNPRPHNKNKVHRTAMGSVL